MVAVLKWLLRYLILPLVILAVVLGAAGYYGFRYARALLDPVDPSAPLAVAVKIPQGATMADVAEILRRHRLIREPLVFRLYARQEQLDSQIKPGEYLLRANMTADEILKRLTTGEVITYRFTVPEGLTVEQVAELLASRHLVDQDKFMRTVTASIAADGWVPADAKVRHRLEGYLSPETYTYTGTINEVKIVDMMVGRFQQIMSGDLLRRAEEMQLSVHEVVTLASIVEEEAAAPAERPRIAGVYLNRLRIGMKLDADPTVRYALRKPPVEPLLYKDLEVKDPYNTYRNPGLPPGPISSPGEASIRAVLYPEDHQFLYFVARGDGSGEHIFTNTLREHNQAVAQAERERRERAAAGGQ